MGITSSTSSTTPSRTRSKTTFRPFLTIPEDVIGVIASFSNTHLANLRQCDHCLNNLAILPKAICRYGHVNYDPFLPNSGRFEEFYGISIPCTAEEAIEILKKTTIGGFDLHEDDRTKILALLDVILEEVRAIGVDRYNALNKVLDNHRESGLDAILGGWWDGAEDVCFMHAPDTMLRQIECIDGCIDGYQCMKLLDLAPHMVIQTTPTKSITIEQCDGCAFLTFGCRNYWCNNKAEYKFGHQVYPVDGGDGGDNCGIRSGLFCPSCYAMRVKTCSHEGCDWRGCVCNFLPCVGDGCSNFMCRRKKGEEFGEGHLFFVKSGEWKSGEWDEDEDEEEEKERPVWDEETKKMLVYCQSCAPQNSVGWIDEDY